MRSMIDGVLEGFGLGAIINNTFISLLCYETLFYKIKTIFFTLITLIN